MGLLPMYDILWLLASSVPQAQEYIRIVAVTDYVDNLYQKLKSRWRPSLKYCYSFLCFFSATKQYSAKLIQSSQ